MRQFAPGQIVFVAQHSKRSFFLYRKYRNSGVICGCRLKHDVQLVVDSQFPDGTVILTTRAEPKRMCVMDSEDLEAMYEES
jgi:hypothetical protein